MNWMLLDEAGNAVGTYDDQVAAFVAFRSLAEHEGREAAEQVLLLAYDDVGHPLGDALTYDELPQSSFCMAAGAPGAQQLFWTTRPTRGFGGASVAIEGTARPRSADTVAV